MIIPALTQEGERHQGGLGCGLSIRQLTVHFQFFVLSADVKGTFHVHLSQVLESEWRSPLHILPQLRASVPENG